MKLLQIACLHTDHVLAQKQQMNTISKCQNTCFAHQIEISAHGGGGGTLIFAYNFYYTKAWPFIWVENLEFKYFWGFQINEYLWGYEDYNLWIFFGGHHKIRLVLGVIYAFYAFKGHSLGYA